MPIFTSIQPYPEIKRSDLKEGMLVRNLEQCFIPDNNHYVVLAMTEEDAERWVDFYSYKGGDLCLYSSMVYGDDPMRCESYSSMMHIEEYGSMLCVKETIEGMDVDEIKSLVNGNGREIGSYYNCQKQ